MVKEDDKKKVSKKNDVKKTIKSTNVKNNKGKNKNVVVKKKVFKKVRIKPKVIEKKKVEIVRKRVKQDIKEKKNLNEDENKNRNEDEKIKKIKREELEAKQKERAEKREDRQERRERKRERRRKRRKFTRIIKLVIFLFNLYFILNIYAITQLNTDVTIESVQEELFNFEIDPANLTFPDSNRDLNINIENPTWIPVLFPSIGIDVRQKDMKIVNARVDWFRVKPKSKKVVNVDVMINYKEFLPLLIKQQLSGEKMDGKAEIDLFLFKKRVYTLEQNLFGF